MKHDFEVIKFISSHNSVAFKIIGLSIQVLFHYCYETS